MNKSGNIEKLYRETFTDFEADVDPGTWERIEQTMNAGPAASDLISGSGSGKAAAGWIAGGSIVVVGLVAGILYFSAPEDNRLAATEWVQPASVEFPENIEPGQPGENHGMAVAPVAQAERTEPAAEAGLERIMTENQASHEHFSTFDEIKPLPSQETEEVDVPAESPETTVPAATEVVNSKPETAGPEQASEVHEAASAGVPEAPARPVAHRLSFPNIITPNGDGKNEIFVVESEHIQSLQVRVIDMAGTIIHQWSNLHGFWDGRLENGTQAPEGKYLINIFAVRDDGQPVREPPFTLILKR